MPKFSYTTYNGNEECHSFTRINEFNPKDRDKCKSIAKYDIGNGKLRCEYHFKKWLKRKWKQFKTI